jgi:hypothetical protein
MPEAKIRIKLGQIEVEYQGEAEFLKNDLTDMLTALVDLQKQAPAVLSENSGSSGGATANLKKMTAGTIARKLNLSSGSDLTLAAAA